MGPEQFPPQNLALDIYIKQPDIPRPDLSDPFTWASICRVQEKWLRGVAKQIPEFNLKEFLLGKVLGTIVGDDENIFFGLTLLFQEEQANFGRKCLLERLEWEISMPELPEKIREKLQSILPQVSALDWSIKEQFEIAKSVWRKMKDEVKEQIELNPELKKAENYSLLISAYPPLNKAYNIFIYGESIFIEEIYLEVWQNACQMFNERQKFIGEEN